MTKENNITGDIKFGFYGNGKLWLKIKKSFTNSLDSRTLGTNLSDLFKTFCMNIESVAVFCGSKTGNNPLFVQHTAELGKLISMLKLKLVYGGGKKGLMGVIADSVLKGEGKVMGVIPKMLIEREQQHEGLTELAIVPDMHTRKRTMYEMSDAAIILPGGFGTMDELFEMLTWNQLKIHNKKIYILNSAGYYNSLIQYLHMADKEGFLHEPLEERILFCTTPIEIFNRIA